MAEATSKRFPRNSFHLWQHPSDNPDTTFISWQRAESETLHNTPSNYQHSTLIVEKNSKEDMRNGRRKQSLNTYTKSEEQQVKSLTATMAFSVTFSPSHSRSTSLLMTIAEDVLTPTTKMQRLDGVTGNLLRHGPVPCTVAIWAIKQQLRTDRQIPFSLSNLPNTFF